MKSHMKTLLSKDSDEKRLIHFKCDNNKIMIGNNTDKIINEFFSSLLPGYHSSELVFTYINGVHYKCNRTSSNCDGSYINSLEWQ